MPWHLLKIKMYIQQINYKIKAYQIVLIVCMLAAVGLLSMHVATYDNGIGQVWNREEAVTEQEQMTEEGIMEQIHAIVESFKQQIQIKGKTQSSILSAKENAVPVIRVGKKRISIKKKKAVNKEETTVPMEEAYEENIQVETEEEKIVPSQPKPIGSIHIQASWLNVRETPNGTILGKVGFGERYDYFEEKNQWLKINYEGKEGYIYGDYGDIYNMEGELIAAANIPTEVTSPPPAAEIQIQENTIQQKRPEEMNTSELCQWVLAQIITPEMNDFAKVRAVNQYLCDHMTYDLKYYTTRDAILLGRGRCQGYTNAFKSLMNTLGLPTDYVRGYTYGRTDSTHAWNRVLINGNYYYVDVTWNDSTGSNSYLLLEEAEFYCDRTVIEYNPRSE